MHIPYIVTGAKFPQEVVTGVVNLGSFSLHQTHKCSGVIPNCISDWHNRLAATHSYPAILPRARAAVPMSRASIPKLRFTVHRCMILFSSVARGLQDDEDHHDHQAEIEAELGIEIDREDHQGMQPGLCLPLPSSLQGSGMQWHGLTLHF